MEPIRPLGVQGSSVRARKKIDEPVRLFSTKTTVDGDTMKWTENTIRTGVTGVKSRKVKREVLREERRRGEKIPISRSQTDNGHLVQKRCRKTSRKLSDGSYFIDLTSYTCRLCGLSVGRSEPRCQ